MKITKFEHSCLLVEMPEPVNRTALFDPGTMSTPLLKDHNFQYLDDIFITHKHSDHMDVEFIKQLVDKFPNVRLTAPADALDELHQTGISRATDQLPEGVTLLEAPHESVAPMFPGVDELGYNYLDILSDPGDSHSFNSTCSVLALPLQAPWGSTVDAVNLALQLKPKYVVPIHDWHWRAEAKEQTYGNLERVFADNGITFIKAVNGEPFVLDV